MDYDLKNAPWPSRMTLREKLELLQISEEDFEFYCEGFIKNWDRYTIMKDNVDWHVIKTKTGKLVKLDEHAVAYHLLGKYWVGTFAPQIARHLSIDIDFSEKLPSIYRIVRDWVPHPIVFQSSNSGGLHVYAFLHFGFPIRANKLHSVTTIELRIRKVETAPGICEVFPAPNKSLRLPLGRGSYLLDPLTLRPMNMDLKASIEFIRTNFYRHSLGELFPGLQRKMKNA